MQHLVTSRGDNHKLILEMASWQLAVGSIGPLVPGKVRRIKCGTGRLDHQLVMETITGTSHGLPNAKLSLSLATLLTLSWPAAANQLTAWP